MTSKELESKVAAAEEKVKKCQKTIERHTAQMEKKAKQLRDLGIDPDTVDRKTLARSDNQSDREIYWLICDYEDKQEDIKGATKKLQQAQRICADWHEKLDLQINTEKVIANEVPELVKQFLQDWKEKAFRWHVIQYDSYQEAKAVLATEVRDAQIEALTTLPEYADLRARAGDRLLKDDYYLRNPWPRKPMEDFLQDRELDSKSVQKQLNRLRNGIIAKMCQYRNEDERLAWLDQILEDEKQAKLLWFYTSVTQITGPIRDVSDLYMSAGDLNGVVLGEKGAAKVQTFSAGGWNIQCFHFRTRIDDVTEKVKPKSKLDDMIRACEVARKESSTLQGPQIDHEKGR